MHIKKDECNKSRNTREFTKDINKRNHEAILVSVFSRWEGGRKKENINRRGDENKNHIKPEERITELTREERFEKGKKMETYEGRGFSGAGEALSRKIDER